MKYAVLVNSFYTILIDCLFRKVFINSVWNFNKMSKQIKHT